MFDFINQNKTWIFSGAGIFALSIIGVIIRYFLIKKRKNKTTLIAINKSVSVNGTINGNIEIDNKSNQNNKTISM